MLNFWLLNTLFEFWLKWNAAKVYTFGPVWGPIYCWKTKNIAKNQDFCKNCILRNNNVNPRSQKNHRILGKLSLKTFFGPKLGLNYHHGSKGHSKILKAYKRTGCQVSVFWYLPFPTLVRRNHKVF